jgi:hypothetical protein
LTADILLHPGMTLSAEEEDRFRRGLADIYRGDVTYGSRLATLWPLFGLRWCLILLNEFLPERWFRRAYADAGLDHATTRARQLDKAEGMLRRVCAEEEE